MASLHISLHFYSMISKKLANGLEVVLARRENTELAVCTVVYKVGAAHEALNLRGMAHLAEHLYFSGTKNIPDYDDAVQLIGGENNAYTSNDYTNYYAIIPAVYIEELLRIEADRMQYLQVSKQAFKIQQDVVVEEFKETTLNVPYGDEWHYLSAAAYKNHAYEYPVIGISPENIAAFKHQEVLDFYKTFYAPNNAILSVVGNIEEESLMQKIEMLFGKIPPSENVQTVLQTALQKIEKPVQIISGNYPANAYYKAFRMCARTAPLYYAFDLLNDILGNGKSSIFYEELVKKHAYFSEFDSYLTATILDGLFIIEGKLQDGISWEMVDKKIMELIAEVPTREDLEYALEKVKNKAESQFYFSNYSIVNQSSNLAYFKLLGENHSIENEIEKYASVSIQEIEQATGELLNPENATVLVYTKEKN